MKYVPAIIASVVLLLLCSTVTTIAQSRYRVSVRQDYVYHEASKTYRQTGEVRYGYDKDSYRGSTFNNDTINYNTMESYAVNPYTDSLVLKKKIHRHYNYDGRIDTISTYIVDDHELRLKSVEVFNYDRWGNVSAKCNYGPVSFVAPPRRAYDKTTKSYQYVSDSKEFGIQLAEKDSFVYANGHKVSELSYCLLENCGFVTQEEPQLPDSLTLKRRTDHTYADGNLTTTAMLYPKLSRMYYPYSLKKMWYDLQGNPVSYSTFAIDRKARHIDLDSLHITYNGDAVTEQHFLYGAQGDTATTINTVHYNKQGLLTGTRKLTKKPYNKNVGMELTVYTYNINGWLEENNYLRFVDKEDAQPASNNIIRISYAPHGHVTEVYKEYNSYTSDGTNTTKKKTTFTYEMY